MGSFNRNRPAMAALLLAAASFFLASWLYVRVDGAIDDIETEGKQRRDQNCKLFERQHLKDIRELQRTYRYLVNLPPKERDSSITIAVLQGLKAQEQETSVGVAPKYCDKKGVGLPEPNPVIPRRPDLSHLGRQFARAKREARSARDRRGRRPRQRGSPPRAQAPQGGPTPRATPRTAPRTSPAPRRVTPRPPSRPAPTPPSTPPARPRPPLIDLPDPLPDVGPLKLFPEPVCVLDICL